jgi:hypothetical protein
MINEGTREIFGLENNHQIEAVLTITEDLVIAKVGIESRIGMIIAIRIDTIIETRIGMIIVSNEEYDMKIDMIAGQDILPEIAIHIIIIGLTPIIIPLQDQIKNPDPLKKTLQEVRSILLQDHGMMILIDSDKRSFK